MSPLLGLFRNGGAELRPDQTLEIEVTLEKDFGALAQFEATLRAGETMVAGGRLTISRRTGA